MAHRKGRAARGGHYFFANDGQSSRAGGALSRGLDGLGTCLVTGASSGIGAAIARELARRGQAVTLVARREARLEELRLELEDKFGSRVDVITADLSIAEDRQALIDEVSRRNLAIEVLVNCAGFAVMGMVGQHQLETTRMVRTNVEAVADLCDAFVPSMIERRKGAILNVSSAIGFFPLPGAAAYAATKAFVLSYTESLHEELRGTGVTATALCPGSVRSEFLDSATGRPESFHVPSFLFMDADDVAKAGVEAMLESRRIVVPGFLNDVGRRIASHLPRSIFLPFALRASTS